MYRTASVVSKSGIAMATATTVPAFKSEVVTKSETTEDQRDVEPPISWTSECVERRTVVLVENKQKVAI